MEAALLSAQEQQQCSQQSGTQQLALQGSLPSPGIHGQAHPRSSAPRLLGTPCTQLPSLLLASRDQVTQGRATRFRGAGPKGFDLAKLLLGAVLAVSKGQTKLST